MNRLRAPAALTVLLLGACVPLYLPPVPTDALTVEPRLRLSGTSQLEAVGADRGTLRLALDVAEVPAPGWLAVQWFGPTGGARASESIWLTPEDAGSSHELDAPAHVELESGEWRAIVSWDGSVVRQFRLELAAP